MDPNPTSPRPKLYATCRECGRENIRTLPNGTLARHKARGQYGFCNGFLAVEGTIHGPGGR